jgi:hypothetical protein
MAGLRFAVPLKDGEPADPAVFATIIPTWTAGDTFLAGTEPVRFRILAIEPELEEDAPFHGAWTVEPVDV